MFLTSIFNDDTIFELPPCIGSNFGARGMEGTNKWYDGHIWSRTTMSNIYNNQGLKFKKSYYVGHLICKNISCDYRTQTLKSNEIEWT